MAAAGSQTPAGRRARWRTTGDHGTAVYAAERPRWRAGALTPTSGFTVHPVETDDEQWGTEEATTTEPETMPAPTSPGLRSASEFVPFFERPVCFRQEAGSEESQWRGRPTRSAGSGRGPPSKQRRLLLDDVPLCMRGSSVVQGSPAPTSPQAVRQEVQHLSASVWAAAPANLPVLVWEATP